MEGGNLVRHVLKKSGKNGQALSIDDLNDEVLNSRLKRLITELSECKQRCLKYKTENEWYRSEIETCKQDTAEYIAYLQSKRAEKVNAIQHLITSSERDWQEFTEKRNKQEAENNVKIEEIRKDIALLETKISSKEAEISLLSDTMQRRSKHEAEMGKIRDEMEASQKAHLAHMDVLEKQLLETRVALQRDAEAKIKVMESAAQEKASKYLADHTALVEKENLRLEELLRKSTERTQSLITQKEKLSVENLELEREHKLRQDMIQIRLKKIQNSTLQSESKKKSTIKHFTDRQQQIVNAVLKKRGLLGFDQSLPQSIGEEMHSLGVLPDKKGKHDTSFEDFWMDITEVDV